MVTEIILRMRPHGQPPVTTRSRPVHRGSEILKMGGNELYNDGYYNPEYYLRDASEAGRDFINGEAFTWTGYISSSMNVLNSFYDANPDAKLAVAVTPSTWTQDETWGSSASYRPGTNFGMMIGFANDALPRMKCKRQL